MKKTIYKLTVITIVIISLLLTGCSQNNKEEIKEPGNPVQENKPDTEKKDETPSKQEDKIEEEKEKTEEKVIIDYEKIKPNELGSVMILMYHTFSDKETNVYMRSFENFKKDLNYYYNNKYKLISLRDFINGNIDVPPGYTPLVITFDDGDSSQFKLIKEAGKYKVDPNTAVGMMEAFYKEHPEFGFEATFFLNEVSFKDSEVNEKETLKYLLDLGLDIGNHTYGHVSMKSAAPNKIQEAIGKNIKRLQEYFPDYQLDMLALPNGEYNDNTFDYVIDGKYEGITYHNKAIMQVGWMPSPPPWSNSYNASKMLRVRASEGQDFDMGYHIKQLEENPGSRFVSDGDKDSICIPKGKKENLNIENFKDKTIIEY